jgi:hypothetical protein
MTYYEILEIDSAASTAEVERAFRRMARKVHPDLNAGDRAKAEAHMKLLNEIRDTLTDPLLRAGYDERLRLEEMRRAAAAPPRAETPRPAPDPRAPASEAATYYAPPPPVTVAEPRRSFSTNFWIAVSLLVLGIGVLVTALLSSPRFMNRLPDPFEVAAASSSDAGLSADAAPLLTAPVAPRTGAPSDDPDVPEVRAVRRARGRGVVVRIGSTTEEVLRALGQPDGYEPGPRRGESVLHYGTLRLEMRNGRVVGGDAAAR